MTAERLLYTRREAAVMLHLSERTLYTLTERGELPAVKVGRSVRYYHQDLIAWAEGKRVHGQHQQ